MEKGFSGITVSERIENRLEWIYSVGGDTIGGAFRLQLQSGNNEKKEYTFLSHTEDWMRNVIGTLHGGSCAALADQAMGCVANCLFTDETHAPTTQLQLNFHRPLLAGDDMLVTVRVVNISRSMLHMAAEIYAVKDPEKLCVSSSAIFFRGRKNKEE